MTRNKQNPRRAFVALEVGEAALNLCAAGVENAEEYLVPTRMVHVGGEDDCFLVEVADLSRPHAHPRWVRVVEHRGAWLARSAHDEDLLHI